jgi:hypothetical protein
MGIPDRMYPMIEYSRDHAQWKTTIRLDNDRLEVTLVGKGAVQTPRITTIPIADLKYFGVVPTAEVQQVIGGRKTAVVKDDSYDGEILLSWTVGGKVKKKRAFVSRQDERFREILDALQARRADASLLSLGPAEVHERMGILTAAQTVRIILGLLIGIPILVVILVLILSRR